jgi:NAD(P)-dependent dehydrogenase (short-subunit alcohol dehydrogenase family)
MSHGRFRNPIEATLTGIKDLFGRQQLEGRLTDDLRADGKTCLVTGASSGLGFAIAVELAKRGGRVVMVSRSGIPEKGEEVKRLSGSRAVEMFRADLSDVEEIDALAKKLRGERLDVVVDNAGVATPRARRTRQGFDAMFATNFLSKPALLTRLLSDGTIRNTTFAAAPRRDGEPIPRIVIVSSDSHRGASAIDWGELGTFYAYGPNKGIENYSYFKLVLNTYGAELARRLSNDGAIDVPVHVMCPGPVDSNIARDAPPALKLVMKPIFRIFFRDPRVAALPAVYMCVAPEFERTTMRYLHMFNEKRMDPKCYDEAEGQRLWDWAAARIGR